MPSETLLAFITYAFVTSVTPGPNNTMLLASDLNYGFVRSLPHALGISIGFAVMVIGVGRRTGSPVRGLSLAVCRVAHRWRHLPGVPGLANRDGRADGGRFGAWTAVRVLESCGFPMGQSEGVDHGHRGHHGLFARWWRHAGGGGALAAVRARQRTQRDGLGHVRYNPTPLADRPEIPSGIQRIHGDNAGAVAVSTSV